MLIDALLLIFSFAGIWIGSGLIITSVEKLSSKIKASPFMISFFLLGFITSVTEISVAFNSYVNNEAEISIGNLLGATIVLFLFVIPLLAIVGKGIKLNHDMSGRNLFYCMILLVSPILLLLDNNLNAWEGVLLIILYGGLAFALYREDKKEIDKEVVVKFDSYRPLVRIIFSIILGSGILILTCNILVRQTIDVAHYLGVAPFIVSLIALSIGTNLPEIILMIRTILRGEKEIAFGNYLGSATFNTFVLGVLAIATGNTVVNSDLVKVFIFIIVGLFMFYYFARSKNELSRKEGIILICIYVLFLVLEIGGEIFK